MPQSLSAVYIHLVFSTKDRHPFLRDLALRSEMHAYLGGVSKKLKCPPVIIGGAEDHVHLLVHLGRETLQSELVKEVKRVSSLWVKQRDPALNGFSWQGGMGYSQLALQILIQYESTLPNKKNITGRCHSLMNSVHYSKNTALNGMSSMSGIDTCLFRSINHVVFICQSSRSKQTYPLFCVELDSLCGEIFQRIPETGKRLQLI